MGSSSDQATKGRLAAQRALAAASGARSARRRVLTIVLPVALVEGSGFPFLDIGGKYLFNSASYNPGVLAGLTQAQIAAALSDPSSAIAKAVDGSANLITAAICSVTGNQPAGVCSAAGVVAAARELPGNG